MELSSNRLAAGNILQGFLDADAAADRRGQREARGPEYHQPANAVRSSIERELAPDVPKPSAPVTSIGKQKRRLPQHTLKMAPHHGMQGHCRATGEIVEFAIPMRFTGK